jgi:hypothetical protein
MLNLEENFAFQDSYNTQKDLIFLSIGYSTGAGILLDFLRSQVPEVNLLQLVPGLYLFFFFLSFLFLCLFSTFFLGIPLQLERKTNSGTKTLEKVNDFVSFQFSLLFLFFIEIFNLNIVIPISLDCFNTYGEKTLENIWSFTEVLNLEFFLLFPLSLLSQLPSVAQFFFLTEQDTKFFPNFWKTIAFSIVILSGFLTPTVDGYTQLSFSFSAFFLYLVFLAFLKRRANLKYQGTLFFGF